jgi:5-(carboxyamino)imidazole ribonucleotide synthase
MQKSPFSSDLKLGILGGGQLGKMMLYTTRKWDITTWVMDKDSSAPAYQGCDSFVAGDIMDYDQVMDFGRQVDVLTIEIENVNVQALADLEKEGKTVYPQSKVLNTVRNKARQKTFYKNQNIPTADFEVFDKPEFDHNWNYPFIWKSAEGGYDGQGVKVVRSKADVENLPEQECIYEQMVDFEMELAVIVARNASGEIATYPPVEMEFHPEANQVEYVICPARVDESAFAKAESLAKKVSETYQHVGLLAVEMFLTKDGEVLVNEVAPRPHNSGHYSIEGSVTDQFEQQVRCVLNLPLGDTSSIRPSVMVNLVGAEGFTGPVNYSGINDLLKIPGVTPHIYGKKETRPFRKMGHVTVTADSMDEARTTAEEVKASITVKSL